MEYKQQQERMNIGQESTRNVPNLPIKKSQQNESQRKANSYQRDENRLSMTQTSGNTTHKAKIQSGGVRQSSQDGAQQKIFFLDEALVRFKETPEASQSPHREGS